MYYVGQTRRNLQSRLDEHNPASNSNQQSDVTKHLLENPTHYINFNELGILCSTYNAKELRKEILLILYINCNQTSTLIFLRSLFTCSTIKKFVSTVYNVVLYHYFSVSVHLIEK